MFKHLTIRQRILSTFLVIFIAGGSAQLILAGWQLQQATLQFYRNDIQTDALIIAADLVEAMDHGEAARLQSMILSLQQERGHDYLIVDRRGNGLAFTEGIGYQSVNPVSQTPELIDANADNIGADIRRNSAGTLTQYVAVPILYEGDALGHLVLADSMQPAYAIIRQQWLQLILSNIPIIVLTVVASVWLANSISRPVQQLHNSALAMAGGALDTRIDINDKGEVGQLAQAFNHMAEHLEALLKTQRSFVSNAAHELRTPLMTLKLRLEALTDNATPADERERYTMEANREIDHMSQLVTSLLILARIDEGRWQKTDTTIEDTTSTLNDIARHWRISASKAGLQFTAEVPQDLPPLPVPLHELRLVLDNLLGNAVKYTQQGNVRLAVYHDDDQITIQVTDTGMGFAQSEAPHLFTRFYRADQSRMNFNGHGLGLSIVKAVLEQSGGMITATSAGKDCGATFSVKIPVTHVPA